MYYNSINVHIIPTIGHIKLNQLKASHIQLQLNDLIDQDKARTAVIYRMVIKAAMKQALIEGYISKDMTLGLKRVVIDEEEKRVLTKDELSWIENTPLTPRERMFLEILQAFGIRRGEALALSKDDIDLKNQRVKIRHSLLLKDSGGYVLKKTKSKRGERDVFIPDDFCPVLNDYISSINSDFLFTMTNGKLMTKSSFRRMWESIAKKISEVACEDITFTPHTFRHTYATNLYYAGVDVKTAQYLLGHASIEITLKIYTHLDSQKMSIEYDKINSFYNKNQSKISQNKCSKVLKPA